MLNIRNGIVKGEEGWVGSFETEAAGRSLTSKGEDVLCGHQSSPCTLTIEIKLEKRPNYSKRITQYAVCGRGLKKMNTREENRKKGPFPTAVYSSSLPSEGGKKERSARK